MTTTEDLVTTEGVGGASARVASYLRDLILHDHLKPGDRIRQEEIAERFGSSRLPVREALRMLLAESVPLLTDDDNDHLEEVQRQIEANTDLDRFLDLDREFHLGTYSGCHIDPLNAMVTRLWNSTQHYRRSYVALGGQDRMWLVNAEHRLILDAVLRRDAVDGERYLAGHIRRTRVELSRHPEVFT